MTKTKTKTDFSLGSILESADKLNREINSCGDEQKANEMEEELLALKERFQELASEMLDPLAEILVSQFGEEKVDRNKERAVDFQVELHVAIGVISFVSPSFHTSFGTQKGFSVFLNCTREAGMSLPENLHIFPADATAADMVEWARTELPMILIAF